MTSLQHRQWVREYTHQLKRSGEWPHVYEVETWNCWWVRVLRRVGVA